MNSRKLSKKVKLIIGVFAGLVLLSGLVFVAAILNFNNNKTDEYQITAASVVYDSSGNRINLAGPATVYKSYYGDYKLKDNFSNVYSLGESTAIFDENSIKIFGGGYQILNSTEVNQLQEYSVVSDLNSSSFFKLSDRHYLITGNSIGGREDDPVTTSDYLYIVMDKTGNAMLLNSDICEKTTSATTISFGESMAFDIPNEELILSENNSIDCASIMGSTNEYNKDDDMDLLRDRIKELKENGQDVLNSNEVVIDAKGGTGGQGGMGGVGGSGGQGGAGGAGGAGGEGGVGTVPDITDARKSMNIYGINASYTTAIVDYSVTDPYGQLGDIYFVYTDVNDESNTNTVTADIDGSRITIFNLYPGTKYKLQLKASADATVNAVQYFYTAYPFATISDVKLDELADTVSCMVSYEEGLSFSQAKVCLKSATSDTIYMEKNVNTDKATKGGDLIVFDGLNLTKENLDNDLILCFKDVMFNNQTFTLDTSYYFDNPYRCLFYWDDFKNTYSHVFNYYCNFDTVGNPTTTNALNDASTKTEILNAITKYENYMNSYHESYTRFDKENIYEQLKGIRILYGW